MSFRSLLEAAMGSEEEEEMEFEMEEDDQKEQKETKTATPRKKKRKFSAQLPAEMKKLESEDKPQEVAEEEEEEDDDDDEEYVDEEEEEEEEEENAEEEDEEEDSDVERHLLGRRARKRKAKAPRGRPRRAARRVKIPPELNGVLGEANMLYASQQYDKAIVLLKDFIKKAPMVPDPYHTLGMIYEDRKDRAKALQFFLIACTLTPQDSELWKRVGRIAQEENNADQAMFCFKKACSANPKDQEAFFIYAEFCKQTGDHRRAAETLKKLAGICPDDLSLWIQAAEEYHFNDQQDEAVDALKTCIEKASAASASASHSNAIVTGADPEEDIGPSSVELNAVNMLADLYITLRKYREAIQIIQNLYTRHAAATAKETEQDQNADTAAAVGLPIDIAVKYGICYLYEGDATTAETMFAHLFEQDVTVYGDLFVDVADAYIAVKNDESAIKVLQKLLDRTEFAMDDIFRKYAECQRRLSKPSIALEYFEKALRYQFEKESLRVNPELMLKAVVTADATGNPEKAIELLETLLPEVFLPPIRPYWANKKASRQHRKRRKSVEESMMTEDEVDNETDDNEDNEEEDEDKDEEGEDSQPPFDDPSLSLDAMENGVRLKLLIRWAYLKKQVGDPEKLCQVGIPVILTCVNQTPKQVSKHAMNPLMDPTAESMGFEVLKSEYLVDITNAKQRDSLLGVVIRVAHQVVITRVLPNREIYQLVQDVALTLTQLGKHIAAIELLTDVNTSDKIEQDEWRFEIRFLALVIALDFGENRMAYECAKLNIIEDPKNLGYWNLFARVISITGVFSYHQKFLAKLLQEDPTNYAAIILAGHRSAAWDIASLTIGELTLAHLRQPQDPLILFCIGLSFLSASMQRTVNDRQLSVAKAFAFLQKYQDMRLATAGDLEKKSSTESSASTDASEPVESSGKENSGSKENKTSSVASASVPISSGIDKHILQLECWYNMGRAHQQLGLFHLAIPMYEQVLRFFELEESHAPVESRYQLCRETAYNLSLIYKKSGADDLARYLIRRYLSLDDD